MPLRYDPAEFGPRAGTLIRALVDEVNALSRIIERDKQTTVAEEAVRAVAGSGSRAVASLREEVYTKAEVEERDASTLATALDAIPDAITLPSIWTADVDANEVKGNRVYAREVTEITGSRVSTWTDTTTGLLGTASSSRRFKDHIVPFDIDPEAVLSIEPKWYSYVAELRKRDDPNFENYVGPEYKVAIEPGMIAEDLHDAGLGSFVVYNSDNQPHGINYVMWVVALQSVVREQANRLASVEQRLSALEKQ